MAQRSPGVLGAAAAVVAGGGLLIVGAPVPGITGFATWEAGGMLVGTAVALGAVLGVIVLGAMRPVVGVLEGEAYVLGTAAAPAAGTPVGMPGSFF